MFNQRKITFKSFFSPPALTITLASIILFACVIFPTGISFSKSKDYSSSSAQFGSYLAGRHAQFNSDPDFAIHYYLSSLKTNPKNLELRKRTIALMVSEGRINEALVQANFISKAGTENVDFITLLSALKNAKNQNFLSAKNKIKNLSNKGLNTFLLPMLQAWVLAGEKKYDEGLKILDRETNNDGLKTLFSVHGALICERAGRNKEAIKRYQLALKLRKSPNLRVTILLGNLYERMSKYDKATELYNKFKSELPNTTLLDGAYKRIKAKRKPAPLHTSARDGVAEALFSLASAIQTQNPFQTLIYGRLASYVRPSLSIANLLVAESLEENNRLLDANKVYSRIIKDPYYSWIVRLRIADNLDRVGETKKAIKALEIMAQENKQRVDALTNMGNILQRHKKYEESSKSYEEAKKRILQFKKRHWSLHYSLGISYERQKKWALAEKNFLMALELQPNQPSVLNYLGYSWVDQGVNLVRAEAMIRNAVKQRPRDGYIVDSLGWVLYRLGNLEGAVKALERAVQIRPEDPTINDHLGDIYWAIGRKREATFQWNRALILDPEEDQITKIKKKISSGLPKNLDIKKAR